MRELFDHIKWITEKQTKDYWGTLNDTERKRWSNYMINRFLSMKMDWISFVNEVQQYNLKPKDLYRLYIDMLPKGKQWLRYVKRKKKMNYPNWLLEIITKDFKISISEARQHLEILYMTEQGKQEIREILMKYGTGEKLIKSIGV
jgi:AAA+ ATPase superfamily predicted ATPase